MVARMLAETLVRQAYLKIHITLRTYSPPIDRRADGEWIRVDPKRWPERTRITVSTGLTVSDRARQAAAHGVVVQQQMALAEKGSTLVNPMTLYRALTDQARMLGLFNVQGYYVDPESSEGQQAAAAKQQGAQRQAQMQQQASMATIQAQGQMLAQVEETKNRGRVASEQMKLQGDAQQIKADLVESMRKLEVDQNQFAATMVMDRQELREKLKVENQKLIDKKTQEAAEMVADAAKRNMEQEQFTKNLALEYDRLKAKVLEMEAKYGNEGNANDE